jgi:hypothetical protein
MDERTARRLRAAGWIVLSVALIDAALAVVWG